MQKRLSPHGPSEMRSLSCWYVSGIWRGMAITAWRDLWHERKPVYVQLGSLQTRIGDPTALTDNEAKQMEAAYTQVFGAPKRSGSQILEALARQYILTPDRRVSRHPEKWCWRRA